MLICYIFYINLIKLYDCIFKHYYYIIIHFRLIIVRIVKFYKGVNIVLIVGLSLILFLVAVYVCMQDTFARARTRPKGR